jgi:DNA-binding transcriptional ArsR family regulator
MAERYCAHPKRRVFPHVPGAQLMGAHELGATVGAWNSMVRRARMTDRQKLAALVVSSYADPDGRGIHCGVTRLAVDLGASYRTAQRYLSWLREVGLIELVREGNRRKRLSDEYRLILGPDVLEHLEVLNPDSYDDARTELRAARSGRRDQASPKNGVQSEAEVARIEDDQASPRVSYKEGDQASNEAPSGVTQGVPPPSNYTSPNRSTSPADDEDLRTDVAVGGAPADFPKPDSPLKCVHKLSGATRADGRPVCALCRVEEARALGIHRFAAQRPPPDPPSGQHLAPVIPLDSRRTS